MEAQKLNYITAKLSKIEEASKKKEEQINEFITQTKEALDQKMETYTEKREAYMNDMKSKLKDHVSIVFPVGATNHRICIIIFTSFATFLSRFKEGAMSAELEI